jgi:AcrR family transcriptional regulator
VASETALVARKSRTQEKRRQQLVEAAFRLIAERGFEGLRTRDVAAAAGVNIATVHYYFPSKESLIGAVVAHAMDRFRSTLASEGRPAEQLGNHLRAVRHLLIDEPQVGVVMGELALRSARDPLIGSIMGKTNDQWHRLIRALLRRAAKAGEIRPELDSDDVASLVMATLAATTLPTMASDRRSGQALVQLERWLGLAASGHQSSD